MKGLKPGKIRTMEDALASEYKDAKTPLETLKIPKKNNSSHL